MNRLKLLLIIFISTLMLYIACGNITKETEPQYGTDNAIKITGSRYNFLQPDATLYLDRSLNEISGLTFDSLTNSLLAINDEKGIIYSLDPLDGKIIDSAEFEKQGDFEGIAIYDSVIAVTKSNGQLYFYNRQSNSIISKVKTALSTYNDVEGLCYNKFDNTLLIACKGNASISKKNKTKNSRAIYKYDLTKNELVEDMPIMTSMDNLIDWLDANDNSKGMSKFAYKNLQNRVRRFAPSGIAQHPSTLEYYVLSYQGKLLIVFDPEWKIKHIEFLVDSHSQPEGICFDKHGNLYIANEANGGIPRIFVYRPLD